MSLAANQPLKPSRLPGVAGRALAWWVTELRDAYQDAARRFAPAGRAALVIEAGERYWMLRQRGRPLGQIDTAEREPALRAEALHALVGPARGAITVEIPAERVLSKVVSLPAGARAELDRILQYEIARHFPFPAERVFFRHRVIGNRAGLRSRGAGPVEVELVAIPRDIVGDIRDELAAAGLSPVAIAVSGGRTEERLFLPPALWQGERAARPRRDRRLAAGAGVLAFAALISWPLAQRVRLAEADGEIAALRPGVEAVLQARDRQRRDAERIAAVLRLRAERPPVVAVLDRLSRIVPDGAWLVSLGLSGRDLVLDGLAPSAATIALGLEQSGAFSGMTFRAPITRDPATGLEHFQLGATLAAAP
ncbi:MAG: PilN domain-containing protein [Alphaproteobacteria bacterium]|nr:PilN domain-containing protein [Alphaproteobacteria bacterium]